MQSSKFTRKNISIRPRRIRYLTTTLLLLSWSHIATAQSQDTKIATKVTGKVVTAGAATAGAIISDNTIDTETIVSGASPQTPPPPKVLVETNEIFGQSAQGRPLWAHILGDGPNVTLIFAAVHGNETATPYLVQQLRAHLKRHPGRLTGRRVVLVPALNPDGLQARRRQNARGVDINRNYPGTWRRPRRGERFRPGPGPASEPETQAMLRLANKYQPQKIVSIHQPLHCLVYSGERSRNLARVIAKENGYRIADNVGYPTPGSFGAYCNLILKAAVVTLELPWRNQQALWRSNARALLAAIELP